MNDPNLILTVPTGDVTATSLDVSGLAHHRSPGSGKHFRGRRVMINLAVKENKPDFTFLDEGGWRDAFADSVSALAAVKTGCKTKTALSNRAFSIIPVSAHKGCNLIKTGGEILALDGPKQLLNYTNHGCHELMTPEQIGQTIGQSTAVRVPRLYMVIAPIQFLILSNLTPAEYAWYATHRPGKIFRKVMFTEIRNEQPHLAAQSRFTAAKQELEEKPTKKTKTIIYEDCLNKISYQDWVGYRQEAEGGLYIGSRDGLVLYSFPSPIPHAWEKIEG